MIYTEKENKALNAQLHRWQRKQLTAVKQPYIDDAFSLMTDLDARVWELIPKAETHKDVNWLVWENADRVIDKYAKIAKGIGVEK